MVKKIVWLVVLLSLLSLLVSLGFWQLNRASAKRDLLALQQQKMQHEQVSWQTLIKEQADVRYRRVQLRGHYDVEHQILMDNQIVAGQVGYFVLTPFIVEDYPQIVLINRGWLAMPADRMRLPAIDFQVTQEPVTLLGIVNHFPQVGLQLEGADEPSAGWPTTLQIMNTQKLAHKLGRDIFDYQVQLLPDQAHGYLRDWQISVRVSPEKHEAYAFQWFALAATLLILSLWIGYKTTLNHD